MIVLGIDPGLLHTGFGVIKSDVKLAYVDCGTISPAKNLEIHKRLAFIYDGLLAKMQEHSPDVVAVEEVFVAANSKTALTLGQVRGVILLAAAHAGVELREFSSTAIKKSVVGFGRAEKGQIGAMVKILLPLSEVDSEHSADALAAAITAAHHGGG